jgi:hypothetical protein
MSKCIPRIPLLLAALVSLTIVVCSCRISGLKLDVKSIESLPPNDLHQVPTVR